VSRAAVLRGFWLPPRYQGVIFLAKPPLRIWAVAVLFRLFGASEWTARVLDAGMGVATVLFVYLAGRALFGRRPAAIAALLLLAAHDLIFLHGLREGVQESALLLTLTSALLLYLLAVTGAGGERWRPGGAGADVACGLLTAASLLVKNAVGLLVLGVTGLFELIFPREPGARGWRRLLPKSPLRILAVALAVYLPWLAAAYLASGGTYFHILHNDVVRRMTEGIDPHHVRHGVYLHELAGDFGPALALLGLAALFGAVAWRDRCRSELERVTFLALWAGAVLAVLSTSAEKLEWYIYPAYPAIALLCGYAADRALAWLAERRSSYGGQQGVARLGVLLVAAYLGVGVVRAWRTSSLQPVRIDADQLARQVVAAGRPRFCLEERLGMREWNVYYLTPLIQRLVVTPADAASCEVLLTEDPARFLAGPLPPGRVHRFHKFDPTEPDTYAVDLAGKLRLDRIPSR
jgi:4-amino-4-deoxy-L-arabinose transferase-like glycosyltransferase